MTQDYSSTASGTWGMRPKPVAIIGTPAVSGTVTSNLSASATVGTATTVTRLIGLTNASQSIKASAGRLFGYQIANPGAAAVYVNFYNSTAPTIGTTQPVIQVLVPPTTSMNFEMTVGIAFGTGITMACTDVSTPLSAVAPATTVQASAFWL